MNAWSARLIAATIVAAAASGPTAAAQTPERGVSLVDSTTSGRGAKPNVKAKPARPAESRPLGNSFVHSNASGTFRLDVTGRLQALYQLAAPDAQTNEKAYGETYADKLPAEATSLFRIRRGRVGLEGYAYDPKYEYNVQVELAGSSLFLKRAYFNYGMRDGDVNLRAGKFKVPFGRQQLTSIFSQQLVDRSLVSDEFAKGDDDGAMVWGAPAGGVLEYYLGVFNGEGNNKNSQQDAMNQYAGRVVWSPLGRFAYTGPALGADAGFLVSFGANANLNGGWLYDVNGTAGMQAPSETCTAGGCVVDRGDDARVRSVGLDAAAKWRRTSWIVEGFDRRVDPRQAGLADVRTRGWYGQAGVFLSPDRYEAGMRYGRLDPNRAQANDRVEEVSPFVNVYLRGNDFKIQTDYTMLRTETVDRSAATTTPRPATLNDARVRVQLLVSF